MIKTKGSLCSQCSIIEYTALIKTVLINEKKHMEQRRNIRGVLAQPRMVPHSMRHC